MHQAQTNPANKAQRLGYILGGCALLLWRAEETAATSKKRGGLANAP